MRFLSRAFAFIRRTLNLRKHRENSTLAASSMVEAVLLFFAFSFCPSFHGAVKLLLLLRLHRLLLLLHGPDH
ncbi:hypothetical protein EYF80_046853 [Liparis tanakae]|uniref:Uncharacterized protein n=1 Tax=Liparis tanakae TaxID=230148 RepID=A0A4Z2FQ85_9TELE|nr:hypothetical protein EYF80_046853 [Liparis tanakae]